MPDIQHVGDIEVEADDTQPPTMELVIDPPIEFAKKRFASLHLQEPTSGQSATAEKELERGPNAYSLRRYQIALVAAVARVPREVVEAMRVTQVEEAAGFLGRLSVRGLPTGET